MASLLSVDADLPQTMGRKRLPPPAAALMQSVRGVGYDARTAVADLIDNSIAAGAATVWIRFIWSGENSTVSILDDGSGMSADQLDRAMTLGSRSPIEIRSTGDLGRFGLGLKTASLSQGSRLVVASHTATSRTASRIWDLRTVTSTDDWLVDDEPTPIEEELIADLAQLVSGTVVLWRDLDRLVGTASIDDERARLDFQRTSGEVEAHLAMTFHRYLEGPRPRLRIFVNGFTEEFRVRAWDPFCATHPATQHMPEARRMTASGPVLVQGFVLPHKDRFDPDEHERAGGPAGWTGQQGFYVYRNERLLVPGSWLGLGKPRKWIKDEQHKLARIRLDLPNALDQAWALDIKKSKAHPPLELRDWLTRNAERVRDEAKEVFVHRGMRSPAAVQAGFTPAWVSEASSSPTYRINREHPAIASLLSSSPAQRSSAERVLRLLESTIPVHRIWLDVADRPESPRPTREQLPADDVRKLAEDLISRLVTGQRLSRKAAVQQLRLVDPFDQYPEILASLEA